MKTGSAALQKYGISQFAASKSGITQQTVTIKHFFAVWAKPIILRKTKNIINKNSLLNLSANSSGCALYPHEHSQ